MQIDIRTSLMPDILCGMIDFLLWQSSPNATYWLMALARSMHIVKLNLDSLASISYIIVEQSRPTAPLAKVRNQLRVKYTIASATN